MRLQNMSFVERWTVHTNNNVQITVLNKRHYNTDILDYPSYCFKDILKQRMLKLKLEVINLRNFSEEIKDLNKTNKFPKDHVEQQGLTVQHELHFYHVLKVFCLWTN